MTDPIVEILDRARQRLAYQQDTAAIAIKVPRQKPLLCKTFKEGIERIIETFNKRCLVCSHIFIPRILIADLVNDYFKELDPVGQRELIMAGYVGRLKKAMVIASAGTLINDNELVGVASTKCKRYCVDANKDSHHVFFDRTIKLEVSDPEGVVWVEIDKK